MKKDKEAPIHENGNSNLAWAVAFVFPFIFCLMLAVEIDNRWQYLLWFGAVLFAIGVFVNVIQCLWAKQRRASQDSNLSQDLLVALELQRKQNDELLLRIKALESQNRHEGHS
jgi:cation transport ATPase